MEELAPVRAYVAEHRGAQYTFELYPQLWERCATPLRMKTAKWQRVFFKPENQGIIPNSPGIYMFVVAPRHAYLRDHTYIFYVGKAKSLQRRYGEYISERLGEDIEHDRERIVDFLSRFKGHLYFHYHCCAESEIENKEDYLVDRIYPWGNTRHRAGIKATILKAVSL